MRIIEYAFLAVLEISFYMDEEVHPDIQKIFRK